VSRQNCGAGIGIGWGVVFEAILNCEFVRSYGDLDSRGKVVAEEDR
jgi:hypothetical protein